jgi:hypothetical protein
LETLLDYIVSKVVNQKIEVLAFVLHQAFDNCLVLLVGVVFQTLFDDIRAELLLREVYQVAHELLTYNFVDFSIFELEHKLNHIVGKRILYESESVIGYLEHQRFLLSLRPCVNAFLHNTASMFVAGDLDTLLDHSVEQELALRL